MKHTDNSSSFQALRRVYFTPVIALMFLILSGCAQKGGTISTNIGVVSSMSFLNTSGGTLVAGQHSEGYSFSRFFAAGENIEVEMELGLWDLAVVTYNGSDTTSGTAECGFGSYRISDESNGLTLRVNTDNCAKTGLRNAQVRACTETSYELIGGPVATNCLPAGATEGGDSLAIRSYKVSYLSHTNMEYEREVNYSQCITEDNLKSGAVQLLTSPSNSIKNIPISYIFYPNPDCSGDVKLMKIEPNLINNDKSDLLLTKNSTTQSYTHITYLNAESSLFNMPLPDNNAPSITTKLQHQLKAKGTSLSLNVASHFTDSDADPLTYHCYADKIVDGSVLKVSSQKCEDFLEGTIAFDKDSGIFNWLTDASVEDSYEIAFFAFDGSSFSPALIFITNTYMAGNTPQEISDLRVWLQPKESYLYQDKAASQPVTGIGQKIQAWRNTINTASESPLMAINNKNNGPSFAKDATATPNIPTLKFQKGNDKSFLSLPDGNYDTNGKITYIIHTTYSTSTSNKVLLSKGTSADEPSLRVLLDGFDYINIAAKDNMDEFFFYNNGPTVEANQKACIAVTQDSAAGVLIYLNGVQKTIDQVNGVGSYAGFLNNNEPLIIGQQSEIDNFGWNGHISELLVWNKVLSPTHIALECSRLDGLYY